MSRKNSRLIRTHAGLLVIDIQDRLLPQIFEKERLINNSVLLIKGVSVLGLPIFATEQYRKGLGLTVPEIASTINGFAPVEKVTFTACGAEGLVSEFRTRKLTQILLCGMETHVCVLQTGLDLLQQDFEVFVVADAVSARANQNHQLGLQRLRDHGAEIVSTEMVLFEMLERAATPEFKQVLAFVR